MKFSKGHACPTCGRSGGEKGNLTTTLDIYTQSVYLTEDGYCFINPYWHKKMIPDPEGFWELRNLLHQNKAPDENGKLVLSKKLDDETTISFSLQKFKFIWIYTNRVLCWLPYEYWDWIKEATFFLRPANEDLPYFGWVKTALMTRYNKANYIWDNTVNNGDGGWVKNSNPTNPKPEEEPNSHELKFLENTWKLNTKYLAEYTHQNEKLRNIYTMEWLLQVKKVVKDYEEKGFWDNGLVMEDYKSLRLVTQAEFEKLAKHIERKIDNTRQGYQLYVPKRPERINDNRMMISLEREIVDEWLPRVFNLSGLWQFQKRPLTKKQIEEWNEYKNSKDETITEPLRTCVFCPSEAGMRTEDYAFDRFILLGNKDSERFSNDWKRMLHGELLAESASEVAQGALEIVSSNSLLADMSSDDIKEALDFLKKFVAMPELDGRDAKAEIQKAIDGFDKEMKKRDGAKQYAETLERERQEDRTRQEDAQRRLRNIETQLANASDDSTRRRLREQRDELQGEIENLDRNIEENNRRLRERIDRSEERTTEMFGMLDSLAGLGRFPF